jgi:hypothetical protein
MRIHSAIKTLALLCSLALPALAGATGNISATDKYAWSETGGWSNFTPTGGGVTVCNDHLEGYAWGESVGWIKLGSHSGGGYFTYANSSAADYGVNLTGANLSGFGWSETAGWISFNPTGGGVTINPATGVFDGWAWSESLGWLHFKGSAVNADAYNVLLAPNPQVNAILLSATDPLKQYAAVEGSGIHLTANNGASWTAAATQPGDWRIKSVVAHPVTPATIYSATHGSGVFKSTDSGDHWAACANNGLNPGVYSLVIDNSGILYAGTKGGVFSSADCADWSPKSGTLPRSGGLYRQIVLTIDPVTTSTLYAGVDGSSVYKSIDSGATWTAAITQPGNSAIRALVIKAGDSTKLYAATYGSGLFASADSGAIWSACAVTGLTNQNIISLTIDGSGKLYAGSEAGVYVSADGCATWTAMNSGLP